MRTRLVGPAAAALLRDPSKSARDHVVTQSGVASNPRCDRSIRVGKWKLIPQATDKRPSPEPFDLEDDLGKTRNLAAGSRT